MSTPIATWPSQRRSGRPGYSGRGLDAVSPPADDPLRVAERIAASAIHQAVLAESEERFGREPHATASEWRRAEIQQRTAASWVRLCASFDAVIDVLRSATPTPVMRQLIRQAERAKANGGGK